MRALAAAAVLLLVPAVVQGAESRDMTLAGFHDLQGRGAYQPVIHQQNNRWIAYIGHHAGSAVNPLTGNNEPNGTSLIDVTDPASPVLLHHIPGPPGGEAQMVRVCGGGALPRAQHDRHYLLRSRGHDAHEVWDVTLPGPPQRVAVVADGLHGTHKNWWECDTGMAYLVSGVPGWRTSRMTQVFDLGDPRRPRFIRNYGLSGQEPGAVGGVPTGLHGAISTGPAGNRVYFGHGTSSGGILQIVDREKLLKGAATDLRGPQIGRYDLDPSYGAHTAFPLTGMEITGSDGRKTKYTRPSAIGVSAIYSATKGSAGDNTHVRQLWWVGIGIVALLVLSRIDYHKLIVSQIGQRIGFLQIGRASCRERV